jgi:hypothetical protein
MSTDFTRNLTMKRTLIAVALAGLFVNAAFADPTLKGDDTYNAAHLIAPKSASQASPEQSNSWGLNQSNSRAPKAYGLINDPARPYYFAQ